MKRTLLTLLLIVFGCAMMACGSNPESGVANNNSSSPTTATPATPTAEPTVVKTESSELADGSTLVVKTYSDGTKTEERSFKTGPLTKVERRTAKDGATMAYVTRREGGEEVEIKDRSWVEKSMDATGDALATAASKTKEGVETAASKTKEGVETAAEKTKEGAKTAAEKTKEGAQKTGSAVKEGAQKVGKGLKKVGEKVKDKVKN